MRFSILVCSKNGGQKLERMLQTLTQQNADIAEIILVDDGSEPPLPKLTDPIRLVRNPRSCGLIACRNQLAKLASHELMMFLDDDVLLDDKEVVHRAGKLMMSDDKIGAVAFQQRHPDGHLLEVQPLLPGRRQQIATYFGWAHLIRRSAWQKTGPFFEAFGYGNEETEFSLRLIEAGYKVIGDPAISVIHDMASSSKNWPKRHFLNQRNILMTILLRYPARLIPSWLKGVVMSSRPHPLANEPCLIFRLRLVWAIILKIPCLWRNRKPVSLSTLDLFYLLQK